MTRRPRLQRLLLLLPPKLLLLKLLLLKLLLLRLLLLRLLPPKLLLLRLLLLRLLLQRLLLLLLPMARLLLKAASSVQHCPATRTFSVLMLPLEQSCRGIVNIVLHCVAAGRCIALNCTAQLTHATCGLPNLCAMACYHPFCCTRESMPQPRNSKPEARRCPPPPIDLAITETSTSSLLLRRLTRVIPSSCS